MGTGGGQISGQSGEPSRNKSPTAVSTRKKPQATTLVVGGRPVRAAGRDYFLRSA